MSVHVSQHPLVRHKQTQLRDIKTDPAAFRALVRELGPTFVLRSCRRFAS